MEVLYHPKVEKELHTLTDRDKAQIVHVVDLFVDYQFRLPHPYLKKMRREVWELRTSKHRLLLGKIALKKTAVVVLFAKKTTKTPGRYIDTAVQRLSEYGK